MKRKKYSISIFLLVMIFITTFMDVSAEKNNNELNLKNNLSILDFNNDLKGALDWSNENYPLDNGKNLPSVEDMTIVNGLLEKRYLNRSDLYYDVDELNYLDNLFDPNIGTVQDIILYGYYTAEAFNMAEGSFDLAYENFLKDSRYGIDNGYFVGSTIPKKIDTITEPTGELVDGQPVLKNTEERIEIVLTVPKGTQLVRLMTDNGVPTYILPRESIFQYNNKMIKSTENNSYVSIQTTLLNDADILFNEMNKVEKKLNDSFQDKFNNEDITFKINPLGLNCGYVLQNSTMILEDTLNTKAWKTMLKDSTNIPYEITFSDYGYVNSDIFKLRTKNMNLEETIKLFDNEYLLEEDGYSTEGIDKSWAATNIKIGRSLNRELILSEPIKYFSSVSIHELFHYIEYNTNNFEDRAMFKNMSYYSLKKHLKNQEEKALTKLLNSSYNEESPEEFMAESFMAKNNPIYSISQDFTSKMPLTNRLLEDLFDREPPTTPQKFKEIEVGGDYVTLEFEQSKDNIGIYGYNIYKDNELIDTILAERDNLGLTYPEPAKHGDSKVTYTIRELEQYTDYTFHVTALDDAQNESEKSNDLKVKTKDTELPELSGTLRGMSLTGTDVFLNWPAPTDNVEVVKIKITRQNSSDEYLFEQKIFEIDGDSTSFNDTTIKLGESYTYFITALDEAGNESNPSNTVKIKTSQKDNEKKNKDKVKDMTSTSANLDLSNIFSFPIGAKKLFKIFGFIFKDNNLQPYIETSVEGELYHAEFEPNQECLFVVVPIDENEHPLDSGTVINVEPEVISSPILTFSNVTMNSVLLTWSIQDNHSSIIGYEVYQDDQLIKTLSEDNRNLNISNLTPNTDYDFYIKTITEKGISEPSNIVSIKTLIIQPPKNLRSSNITDSTIKLTWDNSEPDTIGYEVYQNGKLIKEITTNSPTYFVSNLQPNTQYEFYIKTITPSGTSGSSEVLKVKTLPLSNIHPPFEKDVITSISMIDDYIRILDNHYDKASTDGKVVIERYKEKYLFPSKKLYIEYLAEGIQKMSINATELLYDFQISVLYGTSTDLYWIRFAINDERDLFQDWTFTSDFLIEQL